MDAIEKKQQNNTTILAENHLLFGGSTVENLSIGIQGFFWEMYLAFKKNKQTKKQGQFKVG